MAGSLPRQGRAIGKMLEQSAPRTSFSLSSASHGESRSGIFIGLNRSPRSLFFGFDFFQGLPEQWRSTHKGAMSADGRLPEIDDERVTFVGGCFKDTAPEQKKRILESAQGRTVFVHFDADLYPSTLYLLFALHDMFDEYYFIFDEFGRHEVRALYNFQQATSTNCEYYFHNTGRGLPTVVSDLLRNR